MALFLVGPLLLHFDPSEDSAASAGPLRLPPTCFSQVLFKTPCPGCQLTRSFILLAHGEVRESFRWHRLGLPLYVFFLYQALYRLYCLCRPAAALARRLTALQPPLAWVAIALLLGNWVVGLILGSNGS
jgi:hypothetical protein